jgi:hypothetical protein
VYQKILTARTSPVVTPELLAAFGRFDVPQSSPVSNDYSLLQLFIDAATDQVETFAQTACLQEQVLLTLDFFPNTQDPRNFLQYELSYAFAITPWWWWGFPTKDSIELVRRPVSVPSTAGNNSGTITAVSVANSILTCTVETMETPFTPGQWVLLNGTAEGNNADPQATPSTTPFLNGAQVQILTATATQFTAAFTFGTVGQVFTPSTYTNNSDTGTATVITNPLVISYYDQNGVSQTWNTTNYIVQYDKVCLTVGNWWPLTDRRQDCIQISYWAGNTSTPANVASRLQMAILFLANHFWENRTIISVEPTSEVGQTLCKILGSYRTFRVPR